MTETADPSDNRHECPSATAASPPASGHPGRSPLAIVVDELDVVGVGIEHVRAVVARVVARALPGGAVVAVAGLDRRAVEGVDGGVLAGREGDVEVLGRAAGHEGERAAGADEV